MDRAARDSGCGVPWHLLAAIARVESDFGRNMATSSAGALGYGQFLPTSWESFGNDGNVYDYRDALPAIATYLCQSGLERDPRAALFAYNHADWYVDLVLDLAVRYDRMAPGAPTPGVLDVGPGIDAASRCTTRLGGMCGCSLDHASPTARRLARGAVAWSGRRARRSRRRPSRRLPWPWCAAALVCTGPQPSAADGVTGWRIAPGTPGCCRVPIKPPVLLPAPDDLRLAPRRRSGRSPRSARSRATRPAAGGAGRRALLPGHSPSEGIGDQPIVVIGDTPTGLVYSDPSFSSSLGYGLELSDADFLLAWQAAATPLQALAFSARPLPRAAHLRAAEPPAVLARALPTPVRHPAEQPTPLPIRNPPNPNRGRDHRGGGSRAEPGPRNGGEDDPSWLILLGAGGLLVAATR